MNEMRKNSVVFVLFNDCLFTTIFHNSTHVNCNEVMISNLFFYSITIVHSFTKMIGLFEIK